MKPIIIMFFIGLMATSGFAITGEGTGFESDGGSEDVTSACIRAMREGNTVSASDQLFTLEELLGANEDLYAFDEIVDARNRYNERPTQIIQTRVSRRKEGLPSTAWFRHWLQNRNGFIHPWRMLRNGDAQVAHLLGGDPQTLKSHLTQIGKKYLHQEIQTRGQKWLEEYGSYTQRIFDEIDKSALDRIRYRILKAASESREVREAIEGGEGHTGILIEIPVKIIRDSGKPPRFETRSIPFDGIADIKKDLLALKKNFEADRDGTLLEMPRIRGMRFEQGENYYRLESYLDSLSKFVREGRGVTDEDRSRLTALIHLLSDEKNFPSDIAMASVAHAQAWVELDYFRGIAKARVDAKSSHEQYDDARSMTNLAEELTGVLLELHPIYIFERKSVRKVVKSIKYLRTKILVAAGILGTAVWQGITSGVIDLTSSESAFDFARMSANHTTVIRSALCDFHVAAHHYFWAKYRVPYLDGQVFIDPDHPKYVDVMDDWNEIKTGRLDHLQIHPEATLIEMLGECPANSGQPQLY